VTLALEDVRDLRARLHERAYDLHSHGRSEAAQALWAVVEELDVILTRLDQRSRNGVHYP
jgi:hypothetical protein